MTLVDWWNGSGGTRRAEPFPLTTICALPVAPAWSVSPPIPELAYAAYLLERLWETMEGRPGNVESVVRATTRTYFDCIEERGISLARLWASAAGDPELEHWRHQYRDKINSLLADTFGPLTNTAPEEAKLSIGMLLAACEAAIEQWQAGAVSRELAEESQVQLVLAVIRIGKDVRGRLSAIFRASRR
jgi:hypothetical protein